MPPGFFSGLFTVQSEKESQKMSLRWMWVSIALTAWLWSPALWKAGMATYAYNPSSQELVAVGSRVQDCPLQPSELEASLEYRRPVWTNGWVSTLSKELCWYSRGVGVFPGAASSIVQARTLVWCYSLKPEFVDFLPNNSKHSPAP